MTGKDAAMQDVSTTLSTFLSHISYTQKHKHIEYRWGFVILTGDAPNQSVQFISPSNRWFLVPKLSQLVKKIQGCKL